MKTMSCQQLGGPCGFELRGATADEVIKAQDRHLKDAVAGGDATHGESLKAMKHRWLHPKASMSWRNWRPWPAGMRSARGRSGASKWWM